MTLTLRQGGGIVRNVWTDDLVFSAMSNIVIGMLMVGLPSARTQGKFYDPARAVLSWTGVYPFFVYGSIALALGIAFIIAYYHPIRLTVALAIGVFFYGYLFFVFLMGFLFAGPSGGLGIICVLTLAQLRRHILLFPARRGAVDARP